MAAAGGAGGLGGQEGQEGRGGWRGGLADRRSGPLRVKHGKGPRMALT